MASPDGGEKTENASRITADGRLPNVSFGHKENSPFISIKPEA
jgi:hypothetical protein